MAARKTRTTADTEKAKAARKVRKEQNDKDIAQISADKIAQTIAKVSVDTSKSLATINEVVQSELSKLETVREALQFKEEELSELHGKESTLKSLDELNIEFENKKIELDNQIEEMRAAWEKEQIDHDNAVRERDIALTKKRNQEQADYEYQVKTSRREDENKWQESIYQRQQAEKRRQEDLTHGWEARERDLNKREEEISKKEDLIASFDDRVKAEVDTAVAKAKKSVYAELSVKAQLSESEASKQTALLEQKVQTLEAEAASYKTRIDSLTTDLAAASTEIKDMAKAALEAQSGKQALAAVQQTVEKTSQKR